MQRLASLLLVAAALPLQANSPGPTVEPLQVIQNFTAPITHCYFIKQLNRQLQAPLEKPRFMPIADVEKVPLATPFANCWPDQLTLKATKAVIRK